ncbi:hypothetical protein [Paraburkholderia fungorum]|jgi:hypothetical protein|uniref:hypothetical protein n=1 Tax=Paraburkholderia fungorum TaxID=134537 RepID=UPI00041AACB8|nr:hypothetical protein [Paraburkholderia fungorum]
MEVTGDRMSHDPQVETYRQSRTPAPLRAGDPATRLTRWLGYETWTASEAALLVSGIDPETIKQSLDGKTIVAGTGLCGSRLSGEADFAAVGDVLDHWRRQFKPPEKISPGEFVAWCEKRGVDTRWLRDVRRVWPGDGQLVSLGSFIVEVAEQRWNEQTDESEVTRALEQAGGAPLIYPPLYAAQVLEQHNLRRAIDSFVSAGEVALFDATKKSTTRELDGALVDASVLGDLVRGVPLFPDSDSLESLAATAFPGLLAFLHEYEILLVRQHARDSEPTTLVDLFTLDNWTAEMGLPILIGLYPESLVRFRDREGRLRIANARYLDGSLVNLQAWRKWQQFQHMERYRPQCPTMEQYFARCIPLSRRADQLARLERLWASGSHAPRNPPGYYIEWARRKGIQIGWLEWAYKKGLLMPDPVEPPAMPDSTALVTAPAGFEIPDPVGTAPAADSAATVASTVHRLRSSGRGEMALLVARVVEEARTTDARAVWKALIRLATSEQRPEILHGYVAEKGEGIVWTDFGTINGEETKIFTYDALEKRLDPARRGPPKKTHSGAGETAGGSAKSRKKSDKKS